MELKLFATHTLVHAMTDLSQHEYFIPYKNGELQNNESAAAGPNIQKITWLASVGWIRIEFT